MVLLLWSNFSFLMKDASLPWMINIKNVQPFKEDTTPTLALPIRQVTLPCDLKRRNLLEYNRIRVQFHYSYNNKNNSLNTLCILSLLIFMRLIVSPFYR